MEKIVIQILMKEVQLQIITSIIVIHLNNMVM